MVTVEETHNHKEYKRKEEGPKRLWELTPRTVTSPSYLFIWSSSMVPYHYHQLLTL